MRLAEALPFRRAQGIEKRRTLQVRLHTAEGPQPHTWVVMVAGEMAWQGRRSYASATAVRGLQGLQALSPRRWPPLGAFIKPPALRVVHDLKELLKVLQNLFVRESFHIFFFLY